MVADIAVAGIVVDTVAAVAGIAALGTGVVEAGVVVPPAAAEADQTWLHSWCKTVPHRPLQPHSSYNISPWISSFESVEKMRGFASGVTVVCLD